MTRLWPRADKHPGEKEQAGTYSACVASAGVVEPSRKPRSGRTTVAQASRIALPASGAVRGSSPGTAGVPSSQGSPARGQCAERSTTSSRSRPTRSKPSLNSLPGSPHPARRRTPSALRRTPSRRARTSKAPRRPVQRAGARDRRGICGRRPDRARSPGGLRGWAVTGWQGLAA